MHKGPAFDCTYGRHFPDFRGSFPGVYFSARFFLVGILFARLTGTPPGVSSVVPALSRGGVCNVRKARPIP